MEYVNSSSLCCPIVIGYAIAYIIEPILNLETELSEITEKLRNNSKYTVMLGGDFNAANIDWDTGIVPDSIDNRLMKEKLVTVLAETGLTQMQRDPTRGQNLLDLFCCNKPF